MYEILLKQYREEAGITLRQLSAATGISISTLSTIERNESDPRMSTVVELAKFFDCNLSDFIKF